MKKDDFSPDLYFRELYENSPAPFFGSDDVKKTAEDIKIRAKEIFALDKIPEKTEKLLSILRRG